MLPAKNLQILWSNILSSISFRLQYDYEIIYGNSKKGWIRWRKVVSIQLIRTCMNNNNDDVSQKWNVLLHLLLPKLHTPYTNYYIVWMTLYLTTILVFLANISLTFMIIQSIFACVYGLLLDAFFLKQSGH